MSDVPVLLTIGQICSRITGARGARRVSPSTVSRWIAEGCPGRCGGRIKLRATRAGGRWLVDPADLDAFFAALGADPTDTPTTSPTPPPIAQSRNQESIIRELDRKFAKK